MPLTQLQSRILQLKESSKKSESVLEKLRTGILSQEEIDKIIKETQEIIKKQKLEKTRIEEHLETSKLMIVHLKEALEKSEVSLVEAEEDVQKFAGDLRDIIDDTSRLTVKNSELNDDMSQNIESLPPQFLDLENMETLDSSLLTPDGNLKSDIQDISAYEAVSSEYSNDFSLQAYNLLFEEQPFKVLPIYQGESLKTLKTRLQVFLKERFFSEKNIQDIRNILKTIQKNDFRVLDAETNPDLMYSLRTIAHVYNQDQLEKLVHLAQKTIMPLITQTSHWDALYRVIGQSQEFLESDKSHSIISSQRERLEDITRRDNQNRDKETALNLLEENLKMHNLVHSFARHTNFQNDRYIQLISIFNERSKEILGLSKRKINTNESDFFVLWLESYKGLPDRLKDIPEVQTIRKSVVNFVEQHKDILSKEQIKLFEEIQENRQNLPPRPKNIPLAEFLEQYQDITPTEKINLLEKIQKNNQETQAKNNLPIDESKFQELKKTCQEIEVINQNEDNQENFEDESLLIKSNLNQKDMAQSNDVGGDKELQASQGIDSLDKRKPLPQHISSSTDFSKKSIKPSDEVISDLHDEFIPLEFFAELNLLSKEMLEVYTSGISEQDKENIDKIQTSILQFIKEKKLEDFKKNIKKIKEESNDSSSIKSILEKVDLLICSKNLSKKPEKRIKEISLELDFSEKQKHSDKLVGMVNDYNLALTRKMKKQHQSKIESFLQKNGSQSKEDIGKKILEKLEESSKKLTYEIKKQNSVYNPKSFILSLEQHSAELEKLLSEDIHKKSVDPVYNKVSTQLKDIADFMKNPDKDNFRKELNDKLNKFHRFISEPKTLKCFSKRPSMKSWYQKLKQFVRIIRNFFSKKSKLKNKSILLYRLARIQESVIQQTGEAQALPHYKPRQKKK